MVLIAYYMLHVVLHKMHATLKLGHEGYSHNEHGIYEHVFDNYHTGIDVEITLCLFLFSR